MILPVQVDGIDHNVSLQPLQLLRVLQFSLGLVGGNDLLEDDVLDLFFPLALQFFKAHGERKGNVDPGGEDGLELGHFLRAAGLELLLGHTAQANLDLFLDQLEKVVVLKQALAD